MSFRNQNRRQTTRFSAFPAQNNITGAIRGGARNYKSEQTAMRRHEFTSQITGLASINLGDYAQTALVKFKRSFGSGNDDPPTATASNNYQTSNVFNGSSIRNYTASVKISNMGSSAGIYLDVYAIVTSFSDALYMDTLYNAESPVEFSTAPAEEAGDVNFKSPPIIWTENNYKNFKGIQRNVKFLGTLFMSSEDGGTPSAVFNIRGIPPKCKRSQTGMFYGLIFHYSSLKNTTAVATMDATIDVSFDEIPASNRVPYRW